MNFTTIPGTDLSKGILESIDMDSYRFEKKAVVQIELAGENAEIDPVPSSGGGEIPEPEIDLLSNIIKAFNDQFGKIPWTDKDKIAAVTTVEIPAKVAADHKYQNAMKNNDKKNNTGRPRCCVKAGGYESYGRSY